MKRLPWPVVSIFSKSRLGFSRIWAEVKKYKQNYREILLLSCKSLSAYFPTHFSSMEILAFKTCINLDSSGIPSYGSSPIILSPRPLMHFVHIHIMSRHSVTWLMTQGKKLKYRSENSLRAGSRFYSSAYLHHLPWSQLTVTPT